MNVLLVSTYESGFQSLGTTVAAAHLLAHGMNVKALDLSIEPTPDPASLAQHEWIGFHLPMFHSVPMAVRIAMALKKQGATSKLFFFGLYADLFRRELLSSIGGFVLGTDWEDQLLPMMTAADRADPSLMQLTKRGFVRPRQHLSPARHVLPDLGKYAKLIDEDGSTLTASAETSRGCAHHCTHCPIPPVYGGKVATTPAEVVLTDIDNLVAMGARHVSFVDPDFLNVPRHSLEVVSEMHARYPFLTYDFVAKVSHFRRHEKYLRELAPLGLRFVLTAMEFNDNEVLDILKKKHDVEDIDWSLATFRELGVHLKPTFVMINPWVQVGDVMDLLNFVETRGLIDSVDPIQYKIRLLLFNNSPLIDNVGLAGTLGAKGDFYTEWQHRHAEIEELHRVICSSVDRAVEQNRSFREIFYGVKAIVSERLTEARDTIGTAPAWLQARDLGPVPRFNVPNYCCTEPTSGLEELKGLL